MFTTLLCIVAVQGTTLSSTSSGINGIKQLFTSTFSLFGIIDVTAVQVGSSICLFLLFVLF